MAGPGRSGTTDDGRGAGLRLPAGGLLRTAAVTVAGASLLAGTTAAGIAALLRQARITASRIAGVPVSPGPGPGPASGPDLVRSALAAARLDGSFAPSVRGAVGGAAQQAADADAQRWLPRGDGSYGATGLRLDDVPASGLRLVMLGDSTAVGFGCTASDELPGVMLAHGLARAAGRPVTLRTFGAVGVGAADLARQLDLVCQERTDVIVVLVGANDIRDKVPPQESARLLGSMVERARLAGIPVVVGTCPDFGVIQAIPQPLRAVLRSWSHWLADLQAREVTRAGGEPVAIGRLVSPEFAGRPDLFAADRFHPSGAGYARAADALLPAVLHAALGRDDEAQHTG